MQAYKCVLSSSPAALIHPCPQKPPSAMHIHWLALHMPLPTATTTPFSHLRDACGGSKVVGGAQGQDAHAEGAVPRLGHVAGPTPTIRANTAAAAPCTPLLLPASPSLLRPHGTRVA